MTVSLCKHVHAAAAAIYFIRYASPAADEALTIEPLSLVGLPPCGGSRIALFPKRVPATFTDELESRIEAGLRRLRRFITISPLKRVFIPFGAESEAVGIARHSDCGAPNAFKYRRSDVTAIGVAPIRF